MADKNALDPDRNALGSAIRARRVELGLSQADVARATDISANSINGIERNNVWPSLPFYVRIVRALKAGRIPFVSK